MPKSQKSNSADVKKKKKAKSKRDRTGRWQLLKADLKKYVPGVVVIMLVLGGILALRYALQYPQENRSQAANTANVRLNLYPNNKSVTKGTTTSLQAQVIVPNKEIVTAVQLRILYDPTVVNITHIKPGNWQNKTLTILEPFSTQDYGRKKIAKITLGSYCNSTQCFPLINNSGTTQAVNTAVITVKGVSGGQTDLLVHEANDQNLTTYITTSDQTTNSRITNGSDRSTLTVN